MFIRFCFYLYWGAILDTSYIDLALDPADNVPVISFHGTNDLIVPYIEGNPFSLPIFPYVQGSYLIHQRLENLGIKNRLFPLQGLGHEPQLLQLQTWVTYTIIRQGSKFLYEIMYGDTNVIIGDQSVCIQDTSSYSLPFHPQSQYCWDVVGGTIISQNLNEITVVWNALGIHNLKGYELDKREISKEAILQVEVRIPPTPMISFSSNDGLFDFSASNNANFYAWNFGDGNSANGQFVQHQYTDTGSFTLNLFIEDDYCANDKDSTIASTLCPEAAINILQDDSSFSFINASAFSNQAYFITSDGSIVSADSFSLNFSAEGTYNLSLIASNDYCSDTITQSIAINFCSQADFSYSLNQLTASFNELCYNAFFYNWDFGDGSSSALPNPNHSYAAPGVYDVRLITSSIEACTDTSYKQITIDLGSAIQDNLQAQLSIFPNPFYDLIQVNGLSKEKTYHYSLFNTQGKLLKKEVLLTPYIKLGDIAKGLYFLQISDEAQHTFKKIILKE